MKLCLTDLFKLKEIYSYEKIIIYSDYKILKNLQIYLEYVRSVTRYANVLLTILIFIPFLLYKPIKNNATDYDLML